MLFVPSATTQTVLKRAVNVADVFRRCHALGNDYDVRKIRIRFADDVVIEVKLPVRIKIFLIVAYDSADMRASRAYLFDQCGIRAHDRYIENGSRIVKTRNQCVRRPFVPDVITGITALFRLS